jgi:hypothetical protein
VSLVVDYLEADGQEKVCCLPGIRDCIAAYSRRAYPKSPQAVEEMMDKVDLPSGRKVQLMIDVFPVLWPAGMNVMVPIFFRDPPFGPWLDRRRLWTATGAFRRAMIKRVEAGARAPGAGSDEFAAWIHRNEIVQRFLKAKRVAPAMNDRVTDVSLNPEVWRLAKLFLEVNPADLEARARIEPLPGQEEDWGKATRVLVENTTAIDRITGSHQKESHG